MNMKKIPMTVLAIGLLTGAWQANIAFAKEPAKTSEKSTRIDFEDARIQGQSIVSGAVYLTNRKKNEIETMLDQRTDYRSEILREFKYDVHDEK